MVNKKLLRSALKKAVVVAYVYESMEDKVNANGKPYWSFTDSSYDFEYQKVLRTINGDLDPHAPYSRKFLFKCYRENSNGDLELFALVDLSTGEIKHKVKKPIPHWELG